MSEPTRLTFAAGEVALEAVDSQVKLVLPAGGLTLTEDEAQELARELVLAASEAGGRTPAEVREGWRRWPMQYLRFAAEPAAEEAGEEAGEADGTLIVLHCWVAGQSEANAVYVAAGTAEADEEYQITELLEQRPVTAADFPADHEHRPYFDQALTEGEVVMIEFTLPDEPDEGSTASAAV